MLEKETNMIRTDQLLTIKEASEWATKHLGKTVTTSNISYLIQYGRIRKIGENGMAQVSQQELINYYKSYNGKREVLWKDQLGKDLNWALSFDQYKEAETTKHVHRLHPYKGKFIPQLVEYFLDSHTDNFKKQIYFKKGDIVLDPFSGSGTTLVQSCELGMHGIGIDVSAFNALIGNCKGTKYNLADVQTEINRITKALKEFLSNSHTLEFEEKLLQALYEFNNKYFPVPDYKYRLRREEIKKIKNANTKKIICIILSRTIRSCRATTHADLATLLEPITATYYCAKHGKMCKPLFSILKWWETYTKDTLNRLAQFDRLRTNTYQICLTGDSRTIDIFKELEKKNSAFADLANKQKIKGIFSSPPYVGLIDYHEQHAYAYDLFGFKRNDELEIGPLFKGQGREAKQSYIQGLTDVLNNCKKYLVEDYDIFLVANDKYNMYPTIAENTGMQIINQYKRPVLNRMEKDKAAYSEIVFHLKQK